MMRVFCLSSSCRYSKNPLLVFWLCFILFFVLSCSKKEEVSEQQKPQQQLNSSDSEKANQQPLLEEYQDIKADDFDENTRTAYESKVQTIYGYIKDALALSVSVFFTLPTDPRYSKNLELRPLDEKEFKAFETKYPELTNAYQRIFVMKENRYFPIANSTDRGSRVFQRIFGFKSGSDEDIYLLAETDKDPYKHLFPEQKDAVVKIKKDVDTGLLVYQDPIPVLWKDPSINKVRTYQNGLTYTAKIRYVPSYYYDALSETKAFSSILMEIFYKDAHGNVRDDHYWIIDNTYPSADVLALDVLVHNHI